MFPSSKRHLIDEKVDGIEYCVCNKKLASVYGASTHDVAWTPFLERKVNLVRDVTWILSFAKYSARRLIVSRIIESAANVIRFCWSHYD